MSNQPLDLGLKQAYDELFMNDAGRAEVRKPKVEEIPLEQLSEFPNHPFKVQEGEEMERLIESVRETGVLTPALARRKDEGYELVSGHRRLAACRALGLPTMPVIVRDMTDDEAVITMVDANLQREHVLPSEKAFAYKMKMEAVKHQGKRTDLTSSQVATKFDAAAKVGETTNESRDQVFRYIRLTYLIPELLQLVDEGKIALNPAVELSYLDRADQSTVLDAMLSQDCTPSHAQAIRLKKLSQQGDLRADRIYGILSEEKPNQREQLKFPKDELRRYFPDSYTSEQMKRDIIKGLELLQRQRKKEKQMEL